MRNEVEAEGGASVVAAREAYDAAVRASDLTVVRCTFTSEFHGDGACIDLPTGVILPIALCREIDDGLGCGDGCTCGGYGLDCVGYQLEVVQRPGFRAGRKDSVAYRLM